MLFKISDKEQFIIDAVAKTALSQAVPAFLVGGYVRDKLIGRPVKDIDVVCLGSGIEFAKAVSQSFDPAPKVNYFENFGTAMFKYEDLEVEFVGARKESYRRDSRKPIVENGTLEDDQNRRDFTINALAISLNPENRDSLIDPFNGIQDLSDGIIKTPLDPDRTFSDDPLRMMRAIRFTAQLGFKLEEQTLLSIEKNKERINIVSQERITDELNKIVLSEQPSTGFKLLFNTGLLHIIFPEMADLHGIDKIKGRAHKDNFYHTLIVLDNLSASSNDLWLRWSAILHDIAKPHTKKFHKKAGWTFHGHDAMGAKMVPQIFRNLRLPLNEKMKFVQKMVNLHLRPISLTKTEVTDSAIRRLIFDAGEDIDSLLLLCNADITSKNKEKVKRYLKNFETVREKVKLLEENDRIKNWQPPVSGEIIMKTFGLKPSKIVGELKTEIREAILDGEIGNNFDESYNFLLDRGKFYGLELKERL